MSATPPSPSQASPAPIPSHTPMGQWALRLLVYPLFFGSGMAGLIYEVAWTRRLLNTFGATIFAISAVLAAFMAGLALGAWLVGRRSDQLRRPLRLYAILEILIGVCGLILPWLLSHIDLVDGWAYGLWGQNFALMTTFRFIIAFLLLLVPTTMMGATLPILSRLLVRDSTHLGLHVGALYGTNTLGAVAGAFSAGFIFLGWLGLLHTEWVAVGLNLVVGLLALALARRLDPTHRIQPSAPTAALRHPHETDGERVSPNIVKWVFLSAFVTGAVALAAQVLWTRSLVFSFEYLKNTTYAFSAMLTVFLAGLAVGGALIGIIIDNEPRPLRLYGVLLTLLGAAIAVSVIVLHSGAWLPLLPSPYDPQTGRLNWLLAVLNIMGQTVAVLGVPTLLMGMAFPAAVRVIADQSHVGRDVGRIYSLNTLGAIFGAILASVAILPLLGLTRGLMVLALIDGALGLATLGLARARWHLGVFTPAMALILLIVFIRFGAAGNPLQPLTVQEELVFYEEGTLATVAVIENNLDYRTIYVDGVGVAGTDPILQTDQKSLAHVPMMLLPEARSALTVGFGSGGASYSLLLHDRLQRVDCVEISPTVLQAAPTLEAANHRFFGSLSPREFARQDERYNLIIDDARAYLNYTDQHYDFIATDCTDLRYKSNANLYDIEYFEACRQRLTDQGIVVVWMPLAGLSREVFQVALRTFRTVFPEMAIFFMTNEPTHYILMIGWQDAIAMNYQDFARALEEDDVRRDLAELFLDDPVKLLSCFVTTGDALDEYLAGDTLNTENFPVIEFESPKYGYGDRPLIHNLDDLMERYVSPRRFLDQATMPAEEYQRLVRYEQALPWILKGHAHYRIAGLKQVVEQLEQATLAYLKALEIAPEDLSVRHTLRYPTLTKRLQNEPNNYRLRLWAARTFMLQPQPAKQAYAIDLLNQAEALIRARRTQQAIAPDEFEQVLQQINLWRRQLKAMQG